MVESTKEIAMNNKLEKIVARINVKDTVLHGHCEWYDGRGNLIAYGFFKNGVPFTGTFLNCGSSRSSSSILSFPVTTIKCQHCRLR